MASGPAGWSSPTGTWGSISSTPSYSKPSYTYRPPAAQDPFVTDVNYSGGKNPVGYNYLGSTGYKASAAPTGGGFDWGNLFSSGGMTGIGDLMGGIGGLAQGWGALKDAKLAREALAQQQKQWEQNYESQRLVTNNAIANQNAWKQAQGRTDFGAYVGGKPAGSNYIG